MIYAGYLYGSGFPGGSVPGIPTVAEYEAEQTRKKKLEAGQWLASLAGLGSLGASPVSQADVDRATDWYLRNNMDPATIPEDEFLAVALALKTGSTPPVQQPIRTTNTTATRTSRNWIPGLRNEYVILGGVALAALVMMGGRR